MALVLTIKDAVFTNYVTILTPPTNPYAQFKFGGDLVKSTSDKSGNNHNLTTLGATTGIAFTPSTVKLPQTANGNNALVLSNLVTAGSFTLAYKVESGLYEKLGVMPDSSGILVESSGIPALSIAAASNSTGAIMRVYAPSAITRPIIIIATVDVSVVNKVTLKIRTKDDFGNVQQNSETFTGTLVPAFASQQIRLGSANAGNLELGSFIAYNRALSDLEQDALIEYMSQ